MSITLTLAIRPEKSAFLTDRRGDRDQATVAGKVLEHLFQGDILRTSVDIGAHAPFLIDTQLSSAGASQRLPPTGSEVAIGIDMGSVVVFPGWSDT